ncbi:dehydrogenase [Arthrobacter nitrophenolicus]|uniref:Dehydrogenase n=1 Tax=Arthrobacter nitrophenolicus TaxID=683150 RepID=L8TQ40_9MICC|nr:dehydrogenase [Arthrobacter nitrophenolicus]
MLGLVGVGRIGVMHTNNIAALNGLLHGIDVRLRLTDVAEEHARNVAAELDAEFLPSVEALLASGVQGLVIATGTGTHPELIRAGVDAGIPVFCEKPVAMNVEDALPVLDYIRSNNGVVQVGHQRRFDAGYLEARRAFRAGELGWIHSLRAVTCDVAPPPVEFLATSGGLFRDCSVHDFDILRWLTGREIVEVYAKGSNNGDAAIGSVGDVDTALALVTFDDGTVGTVSASRYNGAGHDVRLEIQGSAASLVVGLDDRSAMVSAEPGVAFPAGKPHRTFAERFDQAYRSEMQAFVELILGRRKNPCTPEDAVAASRVADAAQESLASGLPVRVASAVPSRMPDTQGKPVSSLRAVWGGRPRGVPVRGCPALR